MCSRRRRAVEIMAATVAIAAGLVGSAEAGPVWDEAGDAGSTPASSQATSGSGKLENIRGELSATALVGADFEDIYLVRICDPSLFRASMLDVHGGDAQFDPQLFLFKPAGGGMAQGLLANDNAFVGTSRAVLLPDATDGSGASIETPGRYLLAVSVSDRDPFSAGGAIFDQQGPFEISGPDGPGGGQSLVSWGGDPGPIFMDGLYIIALRSVTFGSTADIDCNCDGIDDACDIAFGKSQDVNRDTIPDECVCRADLDGSGDVGFTDLSALLSSWGTCAFCFEDIDCNGAIGFADLSTLLSSWGPCP